MQSEQVLWREQKRSLLSPIGSATSDELGKALRKRLKELAGFSNVPKPIAMRNTQNAVVYYLFFASHKPVAEDIVKYIFNKYANRGGG